MLKDCGLFDVVQSAREQFRKLSQAFCFENGHRQFWTITFRINQNWLHLQCEALVARCVMVWVVILTARARECSPVKPLEGMQSTASPVNTRGLIKVDVVWRPSTIEGLHQYVALQLSMCLKTT